MIEIISSQILDDEIKLGEVGEFDIIKTEPDIRIRVFLVHQNLFYLKPIMDWTFEEHIRVFPEAPGDYISSVEWRNRFGQKGWVKKSFRETIGKDTLRSPFQIKSDPNTTLFAPSEWEGRQLIGYEKPVFDILPHIVTPGSVV